MDNHSLRQDKTCLNCKHVVNHRFCGNCGQENTETRKTFHHLFVHFIEDLVHYENSFWKTIINLVIKPAFLTKEYLSGKRLSYLPPVKLYIFISFVTFFTISLIPSSNDVFDIELNQPKDSIQLKNAEAEKKIKQTELVDDLNIKKLDSIQQFGNDDEKINEVIYPIVRKMNVALTKHSIKEITEKFSESLERSFPKILIIYMPFFAFILWLFHNKKRWMYFDHGIFTLHYFSFLLLMEFILTSLTFLISSISNHVIFDTISTIIKIVGYLWTFYYFFPAHYRFYGNSRMLSIFKSSIIFFINLILTVLIFLFYFLYNLINLS